MLVDTVTLVMVSHNFQRLLHTPVFGISITLYKPFLKIDVDLKILILGNLHLNITCDEYNVELEKAIEPYIYDWIGIFYISVAKVNDT